MIKPDYKQTYIFFDISSKLSKPKPKPPESLKSTDVDEEIPNNQDEDYSMEEEEEEVPKIKTRTEKHIDRHPSTRVPEARPPIDAFSSDVSCDMEVDDPKLELGFIPNPKPIRISYNQIQKEKPIVYKKINQSNIL